MVLIYFEELANFDLIPRDTIYGVPSDPRGSADSKSLSAILISSSFADNLSWFKTLRFLRELVLVGDNTSRKGSIPSELGSYRSVLLLLDYSSVFSSTLIEYISRVGSVSVMANLLIFLVGLVRMKASLICR